MSSCPPTVTTIPSSLVVPGQVSTTTPDLPQATAQAQGRPPGQAARTERYIPVISYLPVVLRMPLSIVTELHPEWPVVTTYGSYLNLELPRGMMSSTQRPLLTGFQTPRLMVGVTERSLSIGFEGYPAGGPMQVHSHAGYTAGGVMRDGRLEALPNRP